MISRDDAMAYLGIESEYADSVQKLQVERAVASARAWLAGAVGEDVDVDDPRADELMLLVVGEMFEKRTMTETFTNQKAHAALSRLTQDLIMQLKYSGGC